jgi:hypothetical protein
MVTGVGVLWLLAGCSVGFILLVLLILSTGSQRRPVQARGRRLGMLYVIVAIAAVTAVLVIGLPWWIALILGAAFVPAMLNQLRRPRVS